MNKEDFNNINLVNLSIKNKLNSTKLKQIKDLLFSPNKIKYIEFKDKVSKEDIENIKYYLELSPFVNDKSISKYILSKDEKLKEEVSNFYFLNPSTWNISYFEKDDNYKLTSINTYKKIDSLINLIKENTDDKSNLEKSFYIYKLLIKFKISDISKTDEVLRSLSGSMKGINKAYAFLLNYFGIKARVIKKEDHYITMAFLKDFKYKIKDNYLFNPFLDLNNNINLYKNITYSNFLLSKEEYYYKNNIEVYSNTGDPINLKIKNKIFKSIL